VAKLVWIKSAEVPSMLVTETLIFDDMLLVSVLVAKYVIEIMISILISGKRNTATKRFIMSSSLSSIRPTPNFIGGYYGSVFAIATIACYRSLFRMACLIKPLRSLD
jgi:hypothetical protein